MATSRPPLMHSSSALLLLLLLLSVCAFSLSSLSLSVSAHLRVSAEVSKDSLADVTPNGNNVNVDVFVMAKCPDAQACETVFAQGFAAVSGIINLSLNYIANETSPGVFTCMHGSGECTGDRQQLCARNLTTNPPMPGSNPAWFDFALCQSQDRSNIPLNGATCSSQSGFDFETLEKCAESPLGAQLFRESIAKIVTENDRISCTINLNQQFWCQHNGDWVSCNEGNTSDDFIASVCKRYNGPNPPSVCSQDSGEIEKE